MPAGSRETLASVPNDILTVSLRLLYALTRRMSLMKSSAEDANANISVRLIRRRRVKGQGGLELGQIPGLPGLGEHGNGGDDLVAGGITGQGRWSNRRGDKGRRQSEEAHGVDRALPMPSAFFASGGAVHQSPLPEPLAVCDRRPVRNQMQLRSE